jgi:3-hydroxybutyryl-CoA dehydrogenase
MKMAVIGGGTMGNGIAHVFAQNGHEVTLIDVKAEFAERALKTIEGNLMRQVKKEAISEADAKATLGRLKTATDLKAAAGSALVVEAVFESFPVKKEIFTALDAGAVRKRSWPRTPRASR